MLCTCARSPIPAVGLVRGWTESDRLVWMVDSPEGGGSAFRVSAARTFARPVHTMAIGLTGIYDFAFDVPTCRPR